METTKIFTSGNSQAVRLPKKYRIEGKEAVISKIGDAIIILPQKTGWDDFFDDLELFSDGFMNTRNQPEIQNRKELFE